MVMKKPKTKLATLERSKRVVFLAILWTVLMGLLVSLGIAVDGFNLAFCQIPIFKNNADSEKDQSCLFAALVL